METAIFDRRGLVRLIREQYTLDWQGIHGWDHWTKVHRTGLILAGENEADEQVVELFSLFHDSCRVNDGRDPEHGPRAALFAERVHGIHFKLEDETLDILLTAIRDHTKGYVHKDPTIQVCWDADRLDLPRVGTRPKAEYFGTETTKRMLKR
jgi:uncharacterized protein